MPLIPYTRTPIERPVSDRVFTDTTIKQKARFVSLTHTQDEESTVVVTVRVTMYASDNGAYGPALTGAGFQPYLVRLVADNNCLVSLDGTILVVRGDETDALWQATADLYPEPCLLQGDFFEMLRETQAINIGDLVRHHIAQADARGKFA